MTIREIVYKFRDNAMSYDWLIDELNNYRLQIKAEMIEEIDKLTGGYYLQEELNLLSQVKEAIDKLFG